MTSKLAIGESLHDLLLAQVLLPAYSLASGRRFWQQARRLERLQWESAEQLEARTAQKLRRLIEHATANVSFYRQLFARAGLSPADIKTVGDLERVPLTTRAELRAGFPAEVTAQNVPTERWVQHSTSGSSGMPFLFYGDRAATDDWLASRFFFRGWSGVGLSAARVSVSGPNQLTANLASLPKVPSWLRDLLAADRVIYRSAHELGVEALQDLVERLARRGRYFFATLPSYATWVGGQLLERQHELPAYPEVVVASGESLLPASQDIIQRAFRCPVLNHYSVWETPHLAQTCPDNPALLHVNSERAILRVVGADGRQVSVGQEGRLVLTSLVNFVMPFINYEVGDWAVAGGPCPCGRGLPTLGSIEGRTSEVVRTPRGRAISGVALSHAVSARVFEPQVWQYQFVQPAAETLIMRVVPTSRFDHSTAEELRSKVAALMGDEMTVVVETVDQIPAEPSGKRLVVKSALHPSSAMAAP